MTKQERLEFKRLITEYLKQARARDIRYERIALEAGVSLDTLRRIMYDPANVPSEITIRKILNWFSKNLSYSEFNCSAENDSSLNEEDNMTIQKNFSTKIENLILAGKLSY